jgi:glycosyltransferase involved in cell wall biosynthesis
VVVAHIIKATGLAGAEAHLVALLPALRQLGIECRLIVLAEPGRRPAAFLAAAREAGIPVEVVALFSDADPTLAFRLARRLRRSRAGAAHTHLIHADLHGAAAAALAGVRHLVSSRHNDDPFRRLAPVRLLNQLALRRAARLIAISQALAEFAVRVEGAPAGKVACIHYGLDPARFLARAEAGRLRREMGWGEAAPVVLFVGRLTAQKGVETLAAAWEEVVARCPAARLVVAGDGGLRPRLEAMQARPAANLHLLGWRSDVASLMLDADVVVVPSLWEGFGLVTLEAMAARKPVVASRVSSLPEIVVDGETGLLVPPADSNSLAEAMLRLLGDRDEAQMFGSAGRRRLESQFTVERMAKRHAEVYLAL